MNKGGFQLRKWNSNSKPVRESIKVQEGSPANEMNQIKQEVDYCDSDGIMQVNADTSNEKDSVTSPSQPPSPPPPPPTQCRIRRRLFCQVSGDQLEREYG